MMIRHRKLIRFCLVGAANTAVDYLVFALLVHFHAPLLAAQTAAYGCGVLNSFFMNRKWTFGTHGRAIGQFMRVIPLNLLLLLMSYELLLQFTDTAGLPYLIAKPAVTLITLFINYAGSAWWAYRSPNPRSECK